VQAVIETDAGYVERVTGLPPGPADAQSLLLMRPPDLGGNRKIVHGAWAPAAEPFWRSLGYVPDAEPKPYRYANLSSTTQIFTREAR
jgi:hypothetical protein